MKRISVITFALAIALCFSGIAHSVDRWEDTITVSPNVLVPAFSGTSLSIHSIILASEVIGESLYIEVNGEGPIEPDYVYVDNTGHIAAKFNMEAVYAYVVPPCAVITLYGTFTNGEDFSAEAIVQVK